MSSRIRSLSAIAAAAALAACASTSGTMAAKPVAAQTPAGCVQDTGSRIAARSGGCAGFGRTYTRDDMDRTGATTVGGALPLLDPTLTVTH